MNDLCAVIVETVCAALPDVLAIYLYGSRARGDALALSDVDVAVLPRHPMDPVLRFALAQDVAARVGNDVDLVDLLTASAVLRVEILADALILHDASPMLRGAFEARALGEYARFNEERREILQDIAARGRVYG